MLGNAPFFDDLLRKYTDIFGVLFRNVDIQRVDANNNVTQLIHVPLEYAPREKVEARFKADPEIQRQTAAILPHISYERTSIRYDGARRLKAAGKIVYQNSNTGLTSVFNPVPYNIGFDLCVYTRTIEDGHKIVEQILPFFGPEYTVDAMLIPDVNIKKSIPIILNSVDDQDSYAGDLKERRYLVWTLSFTLKGEFYGPERTAKLIRFVTTNFYDPTTNTISEGIGITPALDRVTVQPGLTSNGQPTSNVADSIAYQDINPTDDYGEIITIYGDLNPKEGTGGANT